MHYIIYKSIQWNMSEIIHRGKKRGINIKWIMIVWLAEYTNITCKIYDWWKINKGRIRVAKEHYNWTYTLYEIADWNLNKGEKDGMGNDSSLIG